MKKVNSIGKKLMSVGLSASLLMGSVGAHSAFANSEMSNPYADLQNDYYNENVLDNGWNKDEQTFQDMKLIFPPPSCVFQNSEPNPYEELLSSNENWWNYNNNAVEYPVYQPESCYQPYNDCFGAQPVSQQTANGNCQNYNNNAVEYPVYQPYGEFFSAQPVSQQTANGNCQNYNNNAVEYPVYQPYGEFFSAQPVSQQTANGNCQNYNNNAVEYPVYQPESCYQPYNDSFSAQPVPQQTANGNCQNYNNNAVEYPVYQPESCYQPSYTPLWPATPLCSESTVENNKAADSKTKKETIDTNKKSKIKKNIKKAVVGCCKCAYYGTLACVVLGIGAYKAGKILYNKIKNYFSSNESDL